MSDSTNPTLGEVLPSDMVANYSEEVLDVTVDEVLEICKYAMPPTSDLSTADLNAINSIYQTYIGKHDTNTDSAYWNKTESENEAYWNKD